MFLASSAGERALMPAYTGYTVPVFCMSSGQVLTTASSLNYVGHVSLCSSTDGSYLEVRALYIAFKNTTQVLFDLILFFSRKQRG